VTENQALLGSHASVRQNLAAKCPGAADRSGERHIVADRSVGQTAPRHLAVPGHQAVYRCEGQAAQEHLARALLLSLWCTSPAR